MNMHSDPRRYWYPPEPEPEPRQGLTDAQAIWSTILIAVLFFALGYVWGRGDVLSDCQIKHRFTSPNAVYSCKEIKDGE